MAKTPLVAIGALMLVAGGAVAGIGLTRKASGWILGDVGWAGQRDHFMNGEPISSAGAGFAALDGFVRFDVSRALSAGRQWRLDLYFEIR